MGLLRYLRFAISVVACALGLYLFSFDEQRVALLRLSHVLKVEGTLQEKVLERCSSLSPATDSPYEKFFVQALSGTAPAPSKIACRVRVESAHRDRFRLRSHWVFLARLESSDGQYLLQKSLHLDFPKPLCLLPFAIFLLMLLFDFRHWNFSWLIALYAFLVAGANLVQLGALITQSTFLALRTDQTFLGLTLIVLWASLVHTRSERENPRRFVSFANLSRLLTYIFGVWSPFAYIILQRLLFPARSGLSRTLPLLRSSAFVATASLYVFSVDFHNYRGILAKSFFLPRYFSFAILLFYAANLWVRHSPRQRLVWHIPRFWRSFLMVALVEICCYLIPRLSPLNTITRLGTGLALSELLSLSRVPFKTWAKCFFPWWGVVFVASFFPIFSQEAGVVDLALTLCDPRIHPIGQAFFSFVGGCCLGFFTGSFPTSFFAFYGLMMKSAESSLIRGALLDGILAGILLSPLSLYTLFPAVQFEIRLTEMVAARFRQLAFALAIGALIYLVGSVNSVQILQPVTFVFLCLVASAVTLRKRNWIFKRANVDKFALIAHTGPHST